MTNLDVSILLQEQIAYYRARAGEYDEWFLRQGRFNHGAELNQRWFDEANQVRQSLNEFKPSGKVLELACGTGLWTAQLAQFADHITAVDASPEVLALNQERLKSTDINYVQTDLFSWQPPELYEVIFFSFWLSHVPEERFAPFWEMVRRALKPGGRVFLVDSLYEPTSTAANHALGDPKDNVRMRRLNDGSTYHIFKIFYEAAELTAKLAPLGWKMHLHQTSNYFLYGWGEL